MIRVDILLGCQCGNRDAIPAPLRVLPLCSSGCGKRMYATGAMYFDRGHEVAWIWVQRSGRGWAYHGLVECSAHSSPDTPD